MTTMKAVVFKGDGSVRGASCGPWRSRDRDNTVPRALDDINEAFDLFSHQRDGVLKVALYPKDR